MFGTSDKPLSVMLLTVLLTLGVFFRLSHLDHKVYWHDEAQTSLHISGYRLPVARQPAEAGPVPIGTLDKFQHLNPQGTVFDVVQTLYAANPHQPPLYFVLAHFWARWCGDSVAAVRALSAVLSILTIPVIWWLARELFPCHTTPWFAVALAAVSPLHVLYAQEARTYSLWMLAIVVSSATLLYALRHQTSAAWSAYAVSLAFGLNTHLLFVLVAVGHAIYVFAARQDSSTATQHRAFMRATLAGTLAFLPWLAMLALRWHVAAAKMDWAMEPPADHGWWRQVVLNLSLIGIDAHTRTETPLLWLSGGMLVLITAALHSVIRETPRRTWTFILCLGTPTLLALGAPDLLIGGRRLATARYLIPCLLAIQLALADVLARKTSGPAGSARAGWRALTVLLLIVASASCASSWVARTWWHLNLGRDNLEVAQILQQAPRPLVASELYGSLLSLEHVASPDIAVLLLPWGTLDRVPPGFSDVFVLQPSVPLRDALEHRHWRLEPIGETSLWRLTSFEPDAH